MVVIHRSCIRLYQRCAPYSYNTSERNQVVFNRSTTQRRRKLCWRGEPSAFFLLPRHLSVSLSIVRSLSLHPMLALHWKERKSVSSFPINLFYYCSVHWEHFKVHSVVYFLISIADNMTVFVFLVRCTLTNSLLIILVYVYI